MRRIITIGTALAVLAAAATAYAVGLAPSNTYTATATFSPSKAGSKSKPVPVGISLSYAAKPTVAGDRAAALTDIKNTFYGVVSNGKDFPKCTVAKITAAHNLDTKCPKGSMVATGGLTALVGAPQINGFPCTKSIHVYNAGQGKLTFYLLGPGVRCLNIATGALAAFPATLRVNGKVLTLDAPIPKSVSFPIMGLVGSLLTEHLKYTKQSKKGHGFFESVGCKHGKRAYTTSFTAAGKTVKVPHTAHCS
jgi:hypothetical protein